MSVVALAAIAGAQVCLLAWIAAWQARAAQEVRRLNGSVEKAVSRLGLELAETVDVALQSEPGSVTPANVRSEPTVIDRTHPG